MDAVTLQAKLYGGYAAAAQRVGIAHALYRATSAINPVNQANQQGTIALYLTRAASATVAHAYGDPLWQVYGDGRSLNIGDYVIANGRTYFIAAKSPLAPPLAVECNASISLTRTRAATAVGVVAYGDVLAGGRSFLMQSCPASLLQTTGGGSNPAALPSDAKLSVWSVLLPTWGGLVLQSADIVNDDLSRRFRVEGAQLSNLGWRLLVTQVGA